MGDYPRESQIFSRNDNKRRITMKAWRKKSSKKLEIF
jgi:hypothetical protein